MFKRSAKPAPTGEDWSSQYLKFLICARRKREDTQERYFYEWGNIHVALMLTTPEVMRIFRRYVQHYSISGVTDDMLVYPLSPMEWDNMADHWLSGPEDLLASVRVPGYVQRMQPHKFGDDAFQLALVRGSILFEKPGFKSKGGVKLVHWFRKRPDLSLEDFNRHWRETYAPAFLEAVGRRKLLRRYVHNTALDLDPTVFQGTLFARGSTDGCAGVEELWFDRLEDLAELRRDPVLEKVVREGTAAFVDPQGSYSMVTTERVVYDFVTPGETDPQPAILDPNSLEAKAIGQGYRDWNIPVAPPKT